ncbi:hypothetical protein H0H10_04255 [Streptomyces sp. TRM S81-3]|uniref:Secreted protein n=1 Tax=Streptomyces griseicoloratus TaxID=2752516 RepID=A0A926QNJ3_9ACTN|nr:hypothetical protein [Streptomyces griseicoloratus]MBD0418388.1 hypothetical protein [Streptomyces griseicoloratus]
MMNSRKIAAAAGLLCGFALIGAGSGHAFGEEVVNTCNDDGKKNVRCVQESEYTVTTDKYGTVHVVNKQSHECDSGTCTSRIDVGEKKES